MCTFDWYEVTVGLAGVLFLDHQKEGSQHKDPKTEMDLSICAAIRAYLIWSEIDRSIFDEEEDRMDILIPSPLQS